MTSKRDEKSVLQKYAMAGYLDFGSKRYSTADRLNAGLQLYTDFILGGGDGVKANDVGKIKVDGGGNGERSVMCLHHLDLYRKAIRVIPKEFLSVVRLVCLEDKEIKVSGSAIDVKRKLYMARVDLCRGLDRLVQFYFGKK